VKICPRCDDLFQDEASFCPKDGTALKKSTDRYLGRTIAARYRLTKKLGQGGMSSVYLAKHVIIDRVSAIKILHQNLSLNPAYRERFLREARAVNRINHKNIVEIIDVGESDGVAYLVMEYVQGEHLLATIQKGVLAWPRAVKIAIQISSALARAHQMNVIHRDLKPENIMLVPEFEEDGVKLMDFGIAKIVDMPSLTFSEQLFGTPGYIAPEYVEGLPIDARADIYSLGVLIYEMVTRALPYDARGQAELLLKPLTAAPIPPTTRTPNLPPDLDSLILKMLARKPEDRPHDAYAVHDALIDILRRYAPQNQSSSPPPGVTGRISTQAPAAEPIQTGAVDGGREAMNTIVDPVSVALPLVGGMMPTQNVARVVTREMATRWASALSELENAIARARKRGDEDEANRAAEHAALASGMIPRIERASRVSADQQANVDRLEAKGREFRANLGHAIDVLVRDRSRERAHLDALRTRHETMELGPPSNANLDARAWEKAAVTEEESKANRVVDDLGFQIETLQKELDSRNEELERDLVVASGMLEGSLSAMRSLQSELVRTIDDGIAQVTASEKTTARR
jgi:serine/threonine-protein kinase